MHVTEFVLELGRLNVCLLFVLGLLMVASAICVWVRLLMVAEHLAALVARLLRN